MKKIEMPASFRIVANLRDRFPFLEPMLSIFRMIFNNVYVKSIVMVGYPIISLILGRVIDFKKYPLGSKEFFIEIQLFLYVSFAYLVLYICFIFVEQYSKYYIELSKHFWNLLNKINVLQRDISTEINHLYKNVINDINFCDSNITNLHIIMENNSIVDKIGGFICTAIYEWLKELSDKDCFNVSFIQRFKDEKNGEYIEMMAYKNEDEMEPSTFLKPILLNNRNEKKYYSRILFERNISEIQVLKNRNEIERNFYLGSLDEKTYSEKKTKQYVAIPVKIKNKTTVMFQITADEKGLLGKNVSGIKRNMKMLLPIINIIQPFYYEDFMMKDLCYNIVSYFGKRKARGK